MRTTLPVRSTFFGFTAALIAAAGGVAVASPVLNNDAGLMTTTATYLTRTTRQDCLPLWWNRGTDLEGGIRFGGDVPASPGFNSGMGAATMGGIDLASLGFSMAETDMALPTNGPAVVIGRSFNHRQGSDTTVAASNGLQGYNWFQSAMPEIVVITGATAADDVLYLVYGANRFMEFRGTGSRGKFRGANGATGIVEKTAGNGSTTFDTYTITDQNGWSWIFWGGNTTSAKADWQLWKKSDPQGLTVYIGDKSSHTSAINNGYANGWPITMYQEFGDPSSPTERRYTFTSTSVGGIARLSQVKAEIKSGGTWASPSGLTEIGRVSYAYYSGATANTVDTDDFYGNTADLKTVKIRTPLTDSGTDLSSGIYDERTKYYRYYDTYNAAAGRHGHPHTIKLVLGFEGARRFDWGDNANFDDSFNNTTATEETPYLKPYSDAFYEYESSTGTQRIATAFFNGECGCTGGGSDGTYTFTYDASSSAGTYRGNGSYDNAWCTRTIIDQPDTAYQVRYFDELGQPLSTVITTNTGGSTHWITGVERDSNGRVTTIHSPANLDTYTHSTGAITYLSSSSTGGLITNIGRVSSGDRTGLIESNGYQTGTGGSNQLLSETTFSQRDASIASLTLSKPYIATSKAYWGTGGTDYDTTTYTPTWWSGTNTSPLYVTLQSWATTLPIVKSSSPDQNGDGTNTATATAYLRKDGRTAFSVATDGMYTAMKYNTVGLPVRTTRDADPNTSGDFDSGYGPGDYSLSTTSNGGLKYSTEATYDNIGRTVTSIVRPDSSTPIKRSAETYYGRLSDHRLATISFPEQQVVSSTLTYYGPAGYSVSNHAGKGEFACTLGIATTTAAKANWLKDTYDDPIDAIENATANLGGSSRANIFGISTSLYNNSGVKVSESRSYTSFATSSTWTGSAGTNYDPTTYSYDVMGRVDRVKDPTNTITRTVFDDIGRTVSRWVGTIDTNGWTSSGNGSGDNMTQIELTEYDSGGVGNSLVTKRTAYVSGHVTTGVGSSTDKRETAYLYDVRGRAIVTNPPLPPSTVVAYDLRNRVTASAQFSSSSGLTAATDPATTGTKTNRVSLSKTFYDSRGQVYKTERWKIDQSDGSDDDSLTSLTWRDAAGRVIKQGGTSNSKTVYDHMGRAIHQYTLARNNDSGYGDASGVSGDIVLEQSDTVYDDADKTGLVVMTASMMRNFDDTTTTGALDTNADTEVYKYTQGGTPDVKGRIQITAYWYDELDRQQDVVQYGTYNYANFDRRPGGSWLGVPSRSSTALRTTTVYNDNGTVRARQDPKIRTGSTPYETRWEYDQAMRKTAEIRNYTGASVPISTLVRDTDNFTRYTYDAGRMATVWVDFNGDGNVDPGDQVTTYSYNVTKGSSTGQSAVKDNRLLDSVLYPERVSGEAAADRTNYFAYNAQGQKIYQKDNNGTELEYEYDTLGRKTADRCKTLASGIDNAVQCCGWAFDTRGMLSTVTQYSSTSPTATYETDQVLYKYDDWGNLTDFRQDNNGVVTNTSSNDLDTHYTYTKVDDNSAVSGKRRSGIRRSTAELYYGMGATGSGTKQYEVSYHYVNSDGGTTLYDDDAGRVTYEKRTYSGGLIWLSDLRYGGVATSMGIYLAESGVQDPKSWGGTTGWDLGFDRFGRPIRTYWYYNTSGAVYVDQRISYDDNSNITTNENGWVTPWSATYESDGLNRLKGLKFGVLSGGSIGTVVQQEDWQSGGTLKLDQTGNWKDYTRTREGSAKDVWSGTTFTDTNVYKVITAKSGTNDLDVTTDKKGMPTKDDTKKPGTSETTALGFTYVYDAWDRLVTAKSNPASGSPVTVEEFRYNGLGHRIAWHYDSTRSGGGAPDGTVDANDPWFYFQYNEKWQQVAMYKGAATAPTEVFVYRNAGLDGYGGSSYIDDVILRERDEDGDGDLDLRLYYLQNWRHDVAALMTHDGVIKEKIIYDAYGRPHSFSPGDISNGTTGRPDGTMNSTDTAAWSSGTAAWNKDIGNSSGVAKPDGIVDGHDLTTLKNLEGTFTGGWDLLGASSLGNRKGYAGYEFDNVLQGTGGQDTKPVYHVRHRVLAADTGKWFQKDPLGYHDSMDLYEYCRSDPEDRRDRYGLCCGKSASSVASQKLSATPAVDPSPSAACRNQSNYVECWWCCSQYASFPNWYEECMQGCGGIGIDLPALPDEPLVRGIPACQEAVTKCKETNADVRYWYERVRNGCRVAKKAFTITCAEPGNCGLTSGGVPAAAETTCSTSQIKICRKPGDVNFCSSLTHELVHAYDCCSFGGGTDEQNCCTELRAFFYQNRERLCDPAYGGALDIPEFLERTLEAGGYSACTNLMHNNPSEWRRVVRGCLPSCPDQVPLPRY